MPSHTHSAQLAGCNLHPPPPTKHMQRTRSTTGHVHAQQLCDGLAAGGSALSLTSAASACAASSLPAALCSEDSATATPSTRPPSSRNASSAGEGCMRMHHSASHHATAQDITGVSPQAAQHNTAQDKTAPPVTIKARKSMPHGWEGKLCLPFAAKGRERSHGAWHACMLSHRDGAQRATQLRQLLVDAAVQPWRAAAPARQLHLHADSDARAGWYRQLWLPPDS